MLQTVQNRILRASEREALVGGLLAITVVTLACAAVAVTHSTTVALAYLLVVLVVASASTRRVAIAISLVAFASFNYFFLPPLGTFVIADAENWVALVALLVVSTIASHLSSEIRRRSQELADAEKDAALLRQGAELRSALISSLRHDLRTPLTAVMVAANNLNAKGLSEVQRQEQADIVRVELDRLNRLFQDMEDLAKIEIEALEIEREWVQPVDIVEAALRQSQTAVLGHPIEMHGMLEGSVVYVDPRLSSAALAHLLENAGQYSQPSGPIEIVVEVSERALIIAVRDRGPGIAAADLERIFDRTYRGSEARRTRLGSGMGLAITRGLLHAANGSVQATNAPDGGAVFTMTLPTDSRATATAVEGA